jgi:hypothetical protein
VADSTIDVTQPFDRPQKLLKIIDNGDGTFLLSVQMSIDPALLSSFNTLETAQLTPIMQLDFIHGTNSQTGVSTVANSATVDTDSGRLRLQSGTNSAGSAIFNSRKPSKYRPGQGITARFTPIFTTGVASSTQIWGAGNVNDGYFFGYNGTAFGILHRHGGTDTWTTQANWTGDKVNNAEVSFVYDPTKGSPVMIKYPFLGFGNVTFWIKHPTVNKWVLVHTLEYSNTVNTIQVSNPSLFFYGQALNDGNTSNLTMYCGSVGFFLSGERSFVGAPKWAWDNNKTGITTETNILTLKNATTYNGVTNRGLIRLNSVSLASSAASGLSFFRFKINTTLGGSPSYTTINGTTGDAGVTITSGNSIVSYDVAGTTITGGTYQWGHSIDNPGSSGDVNLIPYDLFIAPGEIGTFSGFSTITAGLGLTINWSEDI